MPCLSHRGVMEDGVTTNKAAMLPMAGVGISVLLAATSILREMLAVIDRLALQYVDAEAREAGIEYFGFVAECNQGATEDHSDTVFEFSENLRAMKKRDISSPIDACESPAGLASFIRRTAPQGSGHPGWCAKSGMGRELFALWRPGVIIRAESSVLTQIVGVLAKYTKEIAAPTADSVEGQ